MSVLMHYVLISVSIQLGAIDVNVQLDMSFNLINMIVKVTTILIVYNT